jgi:hypothetical protein
MSRPAARLGPAFRFATAIDLIHVTLLIDSISRVNALTNARRLANFKISKARAGPAGCPPHGELGWGGPAHHLIFIA